MIKLGIFDLDGTLLTGRDELPKTFYSDVDLPDDIAGYVDSCQTISPTTRGPVKAAAYSWKNIMHTISGRIVPASAMNDRAPLLKRRSCSAC